MTDVELKRYLLLTGPLDAHANAFIAWLSQEERGGTFISAAHAVRDRALVTVPGENTSIPIDFQSPAVPNRDLAFSYELSPRLGLQIARARLKQKVWIRGHHQRKEFCIPGVFAAWEGDKMVIKLDSDHKSAVKLGMSGSPLVDDQNRVLGVLVREGKSPGEIIFETLGDLR